MHKVSVALCTFNGAKYLEKQLKSILDQTYPIYEIIIVDDCSTDETLDILHQYAQLYSHIQIFQNSENLGSNLSFKKVIDITEGTYIALCDQDDIWFPGKIASQMKQLSNLSPVELEKPLVIYHDSVLIDEFDHQVAKSFMQNRGLYPSRANFKDLLITNWITGCTCLINQRMKYEMQKSDMQNIMMHDYLIALIAYGFGTQIFIDEALMYYRSHSNSVTDKDKVTWRYRIADFWKRSSSGQYLMPAILQSKAFLKTYRDKLPTRPIRTLEKLTNLEKKTIISKFFFKWFSS